MTNYDVCAAFAKGKVARCLNMHSTGDKLFSYYTCIAERNGNKMRLNLTKYSVSTSKQQTYMLSACSGLDYEIVRNIPIGTSKLF